MGSIHFSVVSSVFSMHNMHLAPGEHVAFRLKHNRVLSKHGIGCFHSVGLSRVYLGFFGVGFH